MRLFWIILTVLFGIGLYFLGMSNQASYEKCIADGVLSDDNCYYYSYM